VIGLTLVVLTLLAGAPPDRAAAPPVLVPDRAKGGLLALRGATWELATDEVTIQLRQLTDAERKAFLAQITGHPIDPFAPPPGESPRFLTFLVRVENRGAEPLEYNPIHSWLTTNRKEIQYPIGMADLQSMYHEGGLELPAAYERIAPGVLEHARTIERGATLAGLLVYRAVDARTKSLQVDVELTRTNGKAILFAAPYRRPPKDGDGS
jgi:hypothetical protein